MFVYNPSDSELVAAAFGTTIPEVNALSRADFVELVELALDSYPCGTVHEGPCLSEILPAAEAAGLVTRELPSA